MNEITAQTAAAERPSFQMSSSTLSFSQPHFTDSNEISSYKSVKKHKQSYSAKDFIIIKEVIEFAYKAHQRLIQKNPAAKIDQIQLLSSYETVLKKYGIDPMTDGYYYRMLLKLENSKQGLFKALESQVIKNNQYQVACTHYGKCIRAKAFFSLVSNLFDNASQPDGGKDSGTASQVQVLSAKSSSRSKDKNIIKTKNIANKDNQNSKKDVKHTRNASNKENQQKVVGAADVTQRTNYNNKRSSIPRKSSTQTTQQLSLMTNTQKTNSRQQTYQNAMTLGNYQTKQNVVNNANSTQALLSSKTPMDGKMMSQYYTTQNTNAEYYHVASQNRVPSLGFADQTTESGRSSVVVVSSATINKYKNSDYTTTTTTKGGERRPIIVSQSSNSTVKKSSQYFKTTLQCLRTWKKYVHHVKKQRNEEERQLQNLVISIHFNEQSLIVKSFYALSRVKNAKLARAKAQKQWAHSSKRKLSSKYFRIWSKASRCHGQRKKQVYKALNHWGSKVLRKCLNGWKHGIVAQKHSNFVLLDKFMEVPFAIQSLILLKQQQGCQSWGSKWENFGGFLIDKLNFQRSECLPYVIGAIQRYYIVKTFHFLKDQAKKTKIREQNMLHTHQNYILKTWRKQTQHKKDLYHKGQVLQQNKFQRQIWSCFAQWLNKTTDVILYQNKEQKGEAYRIRTLKFKVLRGFLEYLGARQMTQSQMKKSVNSCFSKLLSRSFQGWKFVAVYNKDQRRQMRLGRKIHIAGLKGHYFMLWLTTAINTLKAKVHFNNKLKSKVIVALQQSLEQVEIQHQIKLVCQDHYFIKLVKNAYQQWAKQSRKSKTERHLRRTIFRYMGELKQKQVFTAWKETACKIKYNQEIKTLALQNFEVQQKRAIFDTLVVYQKHSKEMRLKSVELTCYIEARKKQNCLSNWVQLWRNSEAKNYKYHNLQQLCRANTIASHFAEWLNLARTKINKRNLFFRGRAYKLSSIAFNSWKRRSQKRSDFKKSIHQFLCLRAHNILSQAMGALYQYTRQNEMKRKLKQVASFVFLEKTLKKCFKVFSKTLALKQAQKQIVVLKQRNLQTAVLQKWKMKYLRKDIVKRLRFRKSVQLIHHSTKQWQRYTNNKKTQRDAVMIGLQRYGARLTSAALHGLKLNLQENLKIKVKQQLMYQRHLQKLSKLVLLKWQHYSSVRAQKDKLIKTVNTKYCLSIKFKALMQMKAVLSRRRQYRMRPVKFVNNKIRKMKRTCLQQLQAYAQQISLYKHNFQQINGRYQSQLLQNAFYGLIRTQNFKKYFQVKKEESAELHRNQLIRKTFYGFLRNKMVRRYTGELVRQTNLRMMLKHLSAWIQSFNDKQEERPMMEIADQFFKRKSLGLFMERASQVQAIRMTRDHFKRKSIIHLHRQQKVRAVKQLFQFSQTNKLQKMKTELADKIVTRKIFDRWKYSLLLLHDDKINYMQSNQFRGYQLLIKGFVGLQRGAENLKLQEVQLEDQNMRRELNTKMKVVQAFSDNAKQSRELKKKAFEKLTFLGAKCLGKWFQRLNNNRIEENLNVKADSFRAKRGSQFAKRSIFDEMRIGILMQKERKIQLQTAQQVQTKKIKSAVWLSLRQLVKKGQFQTQIYQEFKSRRENFQLVAILESMKTVLTELKEKRLTAGKAQIYLAESLLRKSLCAFQKTVCSEKVIQAIKTQQNVATLHLTLSQWKSAYTKSAALNKIFSIFQGQQEQRVTRSFFQRIIKLCYYQQIHEQLLSKRQHLQATTFVGMLKRKLIYSQITAGFHYARQVNYKRNVLIALLQNKEQKSQYRSVIVTKLDIAEADNNCQVRTTIFNTLKQYMVQQKYKRLARKSYGLNLLKKSLVGLHLGTMRQQLLDYGHQQVQIMKTSKFFWYWLKAMDNKRQEQEARHVIQYSQSNTLFQAWKSWAQKRRSAKLFVIYKQHQNLKPLAFSALVTFSLRQRYLAHAVQEVQENQKFSLMRDVLLNWMESHNLKKIAIRMSKFHQFKMLKCICEEWRAVSIRNSETRVNMLHIRDKLFENPELYKPLLVIRNFTAFKAFQALAENTKNLTHYKQNRDTSRFAFYLRVLRKGFCSLQINAQERFQRRKVKQLQSMFVQRRWLYNLRRAGQLRKRRRTVRTDAAIFNFLNLQRKAFSSMLEYASQSQQYRIKNQFAEELYYKRIADKAFLALRFNRDEFQHLELLQQSRSNLTYTDVTVGQSRYEQDLSQLQIECSIIVDRKQKKRLIYELYCKKLMYKCFANWANYAMSLNDADGEDELVYDDDQEQVQANKDRNEINDYY